MCDCEECEAFFLPTLMSGLTWHLSDRLTPHPTQWSPVTWRRRRSRMMARQHLHSLQMLCENSYLNLTFPCSNSLFFIFCRSCHSISVWGGNDGENEEFWVLSGGFSILSRSLLLATLAATSFSLYTQWRYVAWSSKALATLFILQKNFHKSPSRDRRRKTHERQFLCWDAITVSSSNNVKANALLVIVQFSFLFCSVVLPYHPFTECCVFTIRDILDTPPRDEECK